MKYKKIAVALTAVFTISALNASAGVFDFETVSPETYIYGSDQYTGNYEAFSTGSGFTSNVISSTGITGSLYAPGNWSCYGGIISNSTSSYYDGFNTDTNINAGSGSDGSSNFGIIMTFDMNGTYGSKGKLYPSDNVINGKTYASSYSTYNVTDPAVSFQFSEALVLNSIDLALPTYTYGAITGALQSDGQPNSMMKGKNIYNTEGTFYAVRIYGLDSNYEIILDNYVDVVLAENSGGEVVILQEGWDTVSLTALNGGNAVNGLAFQSFTDNGDSNGFGPNTPCYIALDNVKYSAIPEPSTYAAIFGIFALIFSVYRKRSHK